MSEYLTIKEFAAQRGVSYVRMRQILAEGRVPQAVKDSASRRVYIPPDAEILPGENTPQKLRLHPTLSTQRDVWQAQRLEWLKQAEFFVAHQRDERSSK